MKIKLLQNSSLKVLDHNGNEIAVINDNGKIKAKGIPNIYEVEDTTDIPASILEVLKTGDVVITNETGDGYNYKYAPYIVHDVTIEGTQKWVYLHWFEADGNTVCLITYLFENDEWTLVDNYSKLWGDVIDINGQGADENGHVDLPTPMIYEASEIERLGSWLLETIKIGDIIKVDTEMYIVKDITINNNVRTSVGLLKTNFDESAFYWFSYRKTNNTWNYLGDTYYPMGAVSVNGFWYGGDGDIGLPCSMQRYEFDDYDELFDNEMLANCSIGDFFVRNTSQGQKLYKYADFKYLQLPTENYIYTLEADDEIVIITYDSSYDNWDYEIITKPIVRDITPYDLDTIPSDVIEKLRAGDLVLSSGTLAYVSEAYSSSIHILYISFNGITDFIYRKSNDVWSYDGTKDFNANLFPRVFNSSYTPDDLRDSLFEKGLKKGDIILAPDIFGVVTSASSVDVDITFFQDNGNTWNVTYEKINNTWTETNDVTKGILYKHTITFGTYYTIKMISHKREAYTSLSDNTFKDDFRLFGGYLIDTDDGASGRLLDFHGNSTNVVSFSYFADVDLAISSKAQISVTDLNDNVEIFD